MSSGPSNVTPIVGMIAPTLAWPGSPSDADRARIPTGIDSYRAGIVTVRRADQTIESAHAWLWDADGRTWFTHGGLAVQIGDRWEIAWDSAGAAS